MYALPLPLEKIPQIWHNAPVNFLCAIFAAVLTNCADVANFVFARKTGDRFDLTGQVRVYDNFNDPILNIFAKLGVATRAEAASIALQKHLLKL